MESFQGLSERKVNKATMLTCKMLKHQRLYDYETENDACSRPCRKDFYYMRRLCGPMRG